MTVGRKFTSWQGEDLSPEYDFTEPTEDVHVIWDEMEVGGRAWKGESDVGTVPFRDERGETGSGADLPAGLEAISLAAHNRWRWTERHGSNTMARGWWGPKDYRRTRQGGLAADRHREIVASMFDANEQLKGIIVDDNRPAETDTARVEWLRDTYLNGSPRPTTLISNTYLASGSNTVNLPAQRVTGDPKSVLEEIANLANKDFFVTVDEELFYDGWDSDAYVAGIRISDRPSEQNSASFTAGLNDPEVESADAAATDNPSATQLTLVPGGANRLMIVFVFNGVDQGTAGTAEWLPKGTGAGLPQIAFTELEYHDGGTNEVTALYLWTGDTEFDANSEVHWDTGGANLLGAVGFCISGAGGTELPSDPSADLVFAATNTLTSGTTSSIDIDSEEGGLVLSSWFLREEATDPTETGTNQTEEAQAVLTPSTNEVTSTGSSQPGSPGTVTASWSHVALSGGIQAIAAAVSLPGSTITFPPIWDVGPAATEDGKQLLSGLRLYYGQGSNTYVYVNDPTTANRYAHYEEALYAPETVTTAAQATLLANTILGRRKYEDRNINVSVGPMTTAQAILVKYGQRISIKARAIAFADDQFFQGRIRQLRWTTPAPDMHFAHMMIERPIKDVPYGVGNRSGSEAITGHLAQGSNSHTEFVLKQTLTTQGDLPYRGASDWTRLGIGASNTHLISDGIVPKWVANTGGGGATDHGALTGLADDDHPQYKQDVTLGSLTPDGSPATVINDSSHNAFPGLCRLDESRVLTVYRKGTGHLTAGNIVAKVGTLNAARTDVSSWGSEFTILDEADDLRLQDALAVIDGKVVIAFRRYDGTDNHDPALLISDDAATDLTSSTTWTTVAITHAEGDAQNYTNGHILKLRNGRYLVPVGWQDSGFDHGVGVLLNDSLDDWSSPTLVTVGAVGAPDYSEIAVEEYPDGTLVAHLSAVDDNDIYESESSDHGATWTSPAVTYGGDGYPIFRRLLSGNRLTVYRQSPNGDNAWRVAAGDGEAYGSETILDTTGDRSAYASLLQLTPTKVLCAYASEGPGGSTATDSDIFTQVFTDASTGFGYHDELAGVTPDQHHAKIHDLSSHFGSIETLGRWEPVTNGDSTTPEIVFSDGDVVMVFVDD